MTLIALMGVVSGLGLVTMDVRDRPVILFEGEWSLHAAERYHPEYTYTETAVGVVVRKD